MAISVCMLREVGKHLLTGDLIVLSLVDAATEYQLRPQLDARPVTIADFKVNDMLVYDWLTKRSCISTALHYAIYHDLFDICKALVKKYQPIIIYENESDDESDDESWSTESDDESWSTDGKRNTLGDWMLSYCLPIAAANGNLDICKWLCSLFHIDKSRVPKFVFPATVASSGNDHKEVFDWLLVNFA